jgi:hypothetical protein
VGAYGGDPDGDPGWVIHRVLASPHDDAGTGRRPGTARIDDDGFAPG